MSFKTHINKGIFIFIYSYVRDFMKGIAVLKDNDIIPIVVFRWMRASS